MAEQPRSSLGRALAAMAPPYLGNCLCGRVQFKLDASVATGAQVPLTISIDGKTSLPIYIPITPLPSSSPGN